jgi:hypothetical protein
MGRTLGRERRVSWLAVEEGQTMLAALAAGALMGILAILLAAIGGASPLDPFRLAASVILHDAGYRGMPAWLAVPIGLAVHFALCAVYGFFYGLLMTDESGVHRGSRVFQALVGTCLGLAIYLLNIQVIARFWYPWFLEPSQVGIALLHLGGFGLALGILSTLADRRARQKMPMTRVTT